MGLESLYEIAKSVPSDINQHVSTLFELGKRVDRITEFGTRTGRSTIAFLAARPKRLMSYDLVMQSEIINLKKVAMDEKINFSFTCADVLRIDILETDLLFIDTLHVHDQMKQELNLHAEKAKRYLVFHDTEIFGTDGELPGTEGIRRAIDEYIASHPHWSIFEHRANNNGLTILINNQSLTG